MRQKQREIQALRNEVRRQERTPRGQAQAEVDRLKEEFAEQERQRGAQAMIEAKKIQAENPTLPTETALLMAESRITNRNGGSLTFDDVRRMAETMTPAQLAKKFAEVYADDPNGLLIAHGWAEKVQRLESANSRGPEIRAKASEIMKLNPNLNLHQAYRRAGQALGILI